jgi:hypothetical protein
MKISLYLFLHISLTLLVYICTFIFFISLFILFRHVLHFLPYLFLSLSLSLIKYLAVNCKPIVTFLFMLQHYRDKDARDRGVKGG